MKGKDEFSAHEFSVMLWKWRNSEAIPADDRFCHDAVLFSTFVLLTGASRLHVVLVDGRKDGFVYKKMLRWVAWHGILT